MRILLVQKDIQFAKELKNFLKQEKNTVDIASSYQDAMDFFLQAEYPIVVLDTWIRQGDSFTLAKHIRERNPKTALIFFSEDTSYLLKKRAFDLGADLFLPHSLSFEELEWNLRALERRILMQAEYQKQHLYWNDIQVDLLSRKVYQGEKEIKLKQKEFSLLALFLKNKGLVLHRDFLQKEICGEEKEISSNIIDSYVKNLRKKIGDERKEGIRTIRGYGYGIKEEEKGE